MMSTENNNTGMEIVVAASGTNARFIPALSLALELRKHSRRVNVTWIGTGRSAERALCRHYRIPLVFVRTPESGKNIIVHMREIIRFFSQFKKQRPQAVVSFGGQESIPVLTAARLHAIPYFIHEQNTVPGRVSRMFAHGARKIFLGFPVNGNAQFNGSTEYTGTPVRSASREYSISLYPSGFNKQKKTILICNGNIDDNQINQIVLELVESWTASQLQVLWQTGTDDFHAVKKSIGGLPGVFLFESVKDMYPYYAASRVVLGHGAAAFLSEVAYFGLPCVIMQSSEDNCEWQNAGYVQNQGWGLRFESKGIKAEQINGAVLQILNNDSVFERMSRKAVDNAPYNAASRISGMILEELGN